MNVKELFLSMLVVFFLASCCSAQVIGEVSSDDDISVSIVVNNGYKKLFFPGDVLGGDITIKGAFSSAVVELIAEEKVIVSRNYFPSKSLSKNILFLYQFSDKDVFAEYSIRVSVSKVIFSIKVDRWQKFQEVIAKPRRFIEKGLMFLPKIEYLYGEPWSPSTTPRIGYTILDQRMCSGLILTKVLYWINNGSDQANYVKFGYLGRKTSQIVNPQFRGFWVAEDAISSVKMVPEQNMAIGETFYLELTTRNQGPCSFKFEEPPFSGDRNGDGIVNVDDFIGFYLRNDYRVRIGISVLDKRIGFDTSRNCGAEDDEFVSTRYMIWSTEKGDQKEFSYKGNCGFIFVLGIKKQSRLTRLVLYQPSIKAGEMKQGKS